MKYFKTAREWCDCVRKAVAHFIAGFVLTARIVFVGLASLFRSFWRFMSRQVASYPSLALGGFLMAVILTWLMTFVSMRARAVLAEEQRDSVSWQFTSFKQDHGYE